MVIVTRSAYKKACESSNSSDVSHKNIIPPWCSSGKVYERKKSRKVGTPEWEMRSTYPLRENIWEYLYENKAEQNFNCSNKRRNRRCKQTSRNYCCKKTAACLLVIWVLAMGIIVSVPFWRGHLQGDLTKLISLTTTFSYPPTSVDVECCTRMKYLAEELAKAEQTLRNTLRSRTMMLSALTKTVPSDTRYITGAIATKGDDTREWGGRVALWGLVPLWQAVPPANIVLALRPPTLSDCWPFIGSYGELIIRLPKIQRISYVTLEHIHPDTARSAPKHFVIYGILANNTRIKVSDEQYRAEGPPKQYFTLAYKQIQWQSLLFRVLSNQGNKKYTCVYRIHLYANVENDLVPYVI